MISQGFPLWAVEHPSHEVPEPDGTVYVVVGWDDGYRMPRLVALGTDWRHTWAPSDGQVFTFTTTDPSERPERWTIAAPDDLRQRMAALADRLVEQDMDTYVAGQIRAELDR